MPSYSIDRKRSNALRRKPTAPWKRPRVWFRFIIAAFSFNLFIAIVTVERHISFSTTTLKSSSLEMNRPRISPLSSRWKSQQQQGESRTEFLTESRIWHRMLVQQEQTKEGTKHHFLCSESKNQTTDVGRQESVTQLSPFGFPKAVRAYVREHENKLSSSNRGSSIPSMHCLAPPSEPSCESLQYTVVIYSSGYTKNNDNEVGLNSSSSTDFGYHRLNNANAYWRNIVVGTMKFLAYPSVERVNLVLQEEEAGNNSDATSSVNSAIYKKRRTALEDCAKGNKYAKRVFNWSRKGIVNVVSASSLWDAIDRFEVPSESVLWIDGDHSAHLQNKISNDTVLSNRFRAWREVPNALLIPKENSLFSPSPLKTSRQDENDSGDGPMCSFPLLHEMMMHTNYLCYLNHLVVGSELRDYTKSLRQWVTANNSTKNTYYDDRLSWDTTTMAIGMLLFSVGDGYIIEEADSSPTANFAHHPLSSLHLEAGGNGTVTTYTKDISNYFGCSCSMAAPRLFPSNTRKCSSG